MARRLSPQAGRPRKRKGNLATQGLFIRIVSLLAMAAIIAFLIIQMK